MSFSIPIKKEVKESDQQIKKVITCNLKLMDTARHNNRALSTLVDNLCELFMCKCEGNSDKNIKIKIEEVQDNKVIYTIFRSCRFKKGQHLAKLIKNFLVHTNYVIIM